VYRDESRAWVVRRNNGRGGSCGGNDDSGDGALLCGLLLERVGIEVKGIVHFKGRTPEKKQPSVMFIVLSTAKDINNELGRGLTISSRGGDRIQRAIRLLGGGCNQECEKKNGSEFRGRGW